MVAPYFSRGPHQAALDTQNLGKAALAEFDTAAAYVSEGSLRREGATRRRDYEAWSPE